MKKFIFAFIATVMLTGVSFGQESLNKAIMVMAVDGAKPHHQKGTDLQTFITESGAVSAQEKAFMTKLHEFLESNKSGKDIFNTYNGKEVGDLKNYKNSGNALFPGQGTSENRGLFGWIKAIAEFVIDVIDSCCEHLTICC